MASATAAGLGVLHARRAHDPVLHLLLDVRVPAHRRLDLGDGRPAGARLPDRRHRRPDHADRRGPPARRRPLAAARRDQPGGRALRPGVRLRGRPHHAATVCARMYGSARSTRTARTSSSTSPSTTSRSCSPRSRRTSTSRACSSGIHHVVDPSELPATRPRVQLLASGVGYPWIAEAQQLLAEDWGVAADTWSVTSWNELARERRRRRGVEPAAPGRGAAVAVRHPTSSAAPRAGRRRSATTCAPSSCRSRAGSRATTTSSAPTASASPTPGPPPGGSSTSTPVGRRPGPAGARRRGRDRPRRRSRRRSPVPDRRPDRRRAASSRRAATPSSRLACGGSRCGRPERGWRAERRDRVPPCSSTGRRTSALASTVVRRARRPDSRRGRTV